MQTPQVGSLSTSLVGGTAATEEMLHARIVNTIVLTEGELVTKNEANRLMVSALKGARINMVTLPWEMLYVLHDGVAAELLARENRALQEMSNQQINMEQLSL